MFTFKSTWRREGRKGLELQIFQEDYKGLHFTTYFDYFSLKRTKIKDKQMYRDRSDLTDARN